MKVLKHLAFALLAVGTPLAAEDLVVFAAASLKGPLDQILAEHGDVRVSYGGSGTLARQVQQGAPADVVLLAHAAWMDVLVDAGAVDAPVPFVGNRLVVVGLEGAGPLALSERALLAALGDGRLAVGFVEAVPAGIYGKSALTHLGLWDALRPKIAEVDNVRGAVALVARGEAPLGVVYRSDAALVLGVEERAVFPAASHPPIIYLGAVTAASVHPLAQEVLEMLTEPKAQDVFAKAGFCAMGQGCAE
ncbi:MAG: molybdate ABC transporter substrate-binding protein [Pseudomonadota bacterium]